MTTGEVRNECDILCKECKTVIISENAAKIQYCKIPKYFHGPIPPKKLKSDISTNYREEDYDSCDISNLVKMWVKFLEIKPKPKEDFDLRTCSIEELEDPYCVLKECWVTENIYDCQNISAICIENTNRTEKKGPIICVGCNKNEIGWSNGYNCLKPAYIIREKVIKKEK